MRSDKKVFEIKECCEEEEGGEMPSHSPTHSPTHSLVMIGQTKVETK